MQIFVGGQKELTLVTLMQNSAKITELHQSEHILAILAFNHLVTSVPNQKNSIFAIKMQIFIGGQKELILVTLMQNSAKITKFCQSEHI